MRVQRTDTTSTEVKLVVEAETTDLAPIKRHVLRHFLKEVRVPGFRVGKAPLELVEKYVQQPRLIDEFMEHALNELYRRALEAEKIKPVSPPKVEVKKFVPFNNLSFEANVSVLGPITLADYKKIKMPQSTVSVTAKDVSNVLESLAQRMAERVQVKRPAKSGDEVLIDFSGSDKQDQKISGAEGKDFPVQIGSGNFIPGFEEQLIDLKTSDTKDFEVKFPDNYNVTRLQGQPVRFHAEIKVVNELKKPKIDDNFAKKAGPVKNLAELKADIKKQLLTERRNQANQNFQNALVQQILSQSKIDVPVNLIDGQVLRMEEEEKRNLTYQGQTWEEHLKAEGISEEEHRQRQRPQAEERVKGGIILSEIAQKEGLTVSEDELNDRIQLLKSQYQDPTMQDELDKSENRSDIAARLLTEKTLEKLTDYSNK